MSLSEGTVFLRVVMEMVMHRKAELPFSKNLEKQHVEDVRVASVMRDIVQTDVDPSCSRSLMLHLTF